MHKCYIDRYRQLDIWADREMCLENVIDSWIVPKVDRDRIDGDWERSS